jgi:acetyltransferase-like isoleucine patch superfamily enzyme
VPSLYRFLALSDHPAARTVRAVRRGVMSFSLPAPRVVVRPMLWAFLTLRGSYHFVLRVFVCEPLFKAYCTRYGRGLRTGVYVHWVEGPGEIVLGDDVSIDGKCVFGFAVRYCERPTLEVGDGTGINHGCRFTVGRRITIGRRCRISPDVWVFDSSGHASDPAARAAGLPAAASDVRPVTIGDDVWVGARSIIFPGVTVGRGSIISAGSVVTGDVPPYTVVAGNPARRVATLGTTPESAGACVNGSSHAVHP